MVESFGITISVVQFILYKLNEKKEAVTDQEYFRGENAKIIRGVIGYNEQFPQGDAKSLASVSICKMKITTD